MSLNPFLAFLKTHSYLLRGRLHFPRNRIGEVLTMEDGQEFVIFRQVVVDPSPDHPEKPGATFIVRFRFAHGSPKQNRLFSLFPIPFIVGLPGFRSKLWTINESNGDFQGIYEWDTVPDAENYAHSFPLKLMTKRSVPGSVFYEIIPNNSIKEYVHH
uniref:Uncharacterized protein n=1 Tax=Candidatus Methanophaga sp. ANME-1 ERB7 TaxID=2759913 RepID=A0A7G9Z1Z7_9EURY|nr:hypothetical protein FGBIHFOD_00021 [Methanosarcinales archaeon ANME-1 ERB7]